MMMKKYRKRPQPNTWDVAYAEFVDDNWHLYWQPGRHGLAGILSDEEFRRQYEVGPPAPAPRGG